MLIHVYGCYGVNMETSFRLEDVYLLKSGWIIVYVHVRGGRELGKNWHLMGMGPNKLNSMLDLISSTNHLHHKLKYSSPSLTAATAHSAGGLVLVSSLLHPECTNLCRNPANEIIRAVVLQAPFLDPVSALLASPLPSELAEWGDVVNKKDDLDLVLSYSPYELIRKHSLNTNLLILAGEQDQRVPISQSIKFICRLKNRLHPAEHKRALLFVDFHSGHFNSFSSPTASEDYDPYHQRVIRNTFLTNVIDSNEYA
ncbi:Prolyl endopeptidase-like [Zancudomyces culisetae]|uniref:Prolyl endopeptidase n=1 Tax=Zancudomyces culisetae TaxID=1213189 RepID=A0A1R1PKS6_ZANCU|nr:Prolyl endopeptidase-like [Zancudomyces culisetae]|eukprot:OMH81564.1 Prolyl endopeptidase-like [Zancudomyces culisetae]